PTAVPAPTVAYPRGRVTGYVYLRPTPSSLSPVSATLVPQDTIVRILEQRGEWVLVLLPGDEGSGATGWIPARWLRPEP
ncbi:MAG: SH3 domain-containing protein, partial [Caldilineae bacterium]